MPAVAMCTCSKKYKLKHDEVVTSKYHVTDHKDGICVYCQHYVHWRHPSKVNETIDEFTRRESREEGVGELDLTKDEAYVYGYKIDTGRTTRITY